MLDQPPEGHDRFVFERDTFAFRNELVWDYAPDPLTGRTITRRVEPPPSYALRCFVMVRACRQFSLHARFEPGRARLDVSECRRRIRALVRRSPRRASRDSERLVFAGFSGLRDLSRPCETVLKAECGGAWRSYVLRSHWRMIFPISRRHQARTAASIAAALPEGRLPILHVVRFPQLTINHGLLVFGAQASPGGVAFNVYDPNAPESPVILTYDRATRTFLLPANRYWAGGRVDAIEVYRSWWF